jgi:hypothetical protein
MDPMMFIDWPGEQSLAADENDHMMSSSSEESTQLFGRDQHASVQYLPNMGVLHKTFSPEPLAGTNMVTQARNIDSAAFTPFGVGHDCFQFKGNTSRSLV